MSQPIEDKGDKVVEENEPSQESIIQESSDDEEATIRLAMKVHHQ